MTKLSVKLLISFVLIFSLISCSMVNNSSCRNKGYKTWYCGYERPSVSYRAMLR